ncbi:MCE family protein [Rhodococcus opacus]
MFTRRNGRPTSHLTTAATILVLGITTLAVLVFAQFRGAFDDFTRVALVAPRSGLILEPGAKVKMLDIPIGRVAGVEERDGYAYVTLDLDPTQARGIPANVSATIESTTVFGAKFVSLIQPDRPSETPLTSDGMIDARQITPELNTVFEELTTVLKAIAPERLNATLTAIAEAMRGRGEQFGDALVQTDAYLNGLRPSLDNLQRDLIATADVSQVYADAVPDVLSSLDSLTTTGQSVVDKQQQLDALLLQSIGFGDSGHAVLASNENAVSTLMHRLQPTSALLARYSSGFACFFQGLDGARQSLETVIGGTVPGVNVSATILPGEMPYRYPRDLPKTAASGGPRCDDSPRLSTSDLPSHYLVTDTGTNPYAPIDRPAGLNILDFMLYGIPGGLR